MYHGGPARQIGLSYRLGQYLGIDSWAPQKVYKYGLWSQWDTNVPLILKILEIIFCFFKKVLAPSKYPLK
jgi:hypothetical protein